MYFSLNPVAVTKQIYISDVYQELCKYQQQGTFRLLKFTDATFERQQQLIDTVAHCIHQSNALHTNSEESDFSKNILKKLGIAQNCRKALEFFVCTKDKRLSILKKGGRGKFLCRLLLHHHI